MERVLYSRKYTLSVDKVPEEEKANLCCWVGNGRPVEMTKTEKNVCHSQHRNSLKFLVCFSTAKGLSSISYKDEIQSAHFGNSAAIKNHTKMRQCF